jgi:hypothetical protein
MPFETGSIRPSAAFAAIAAIDRGAALLQHVERDLRGERMRGRDHAVRRETSERVAKGRR